MILEWLSHQWYRTLSAQKGTIPQMESVPSVFPDHWHSQPGIRGRGRSTALCSRDFRGWDYFSALNTRVSPQTICSGLQEICVFLLALHWPAGCSWKCCFLSTHSSFPIWTRGNYADLFLGWLWEQLRGEAIYWMAFQSWKNAKISSWFHDSLIHSPTRLPRSAQQQVNISQCCLCHRGM